VPPAPKVTSVLTQLYYDRDAVSVANAISQSFSQLKVSPVSANPLTSYADSLIIADPTGTGRSGIALNQARRMIAQIDQPRPQITVNAWSLQVSSEDQKRMRQLVPEARRFAAGYNDALERSIGRAWSYLNEQVGTTPNYLNTEFAAYLCAIAEHPDPSVGHGPFHPISKGKCPVDLNLAYSLGYTDIFDRESPNLVQLMLLVMATNDPHGEAQRTLDQMENAPDGGRPRTGEQSVCGTRSSCADAQVVLSDLRLCRPREDHRGSSKHSAGGGRGHGCGRRARATV